MKRVSGAIFFLLFLYHLHGQKCGVDVNAGLDTTICAEGGVVSLNGLISGSYDNLEWSSEAIITDPNLLVTNAQVDVETQFILSGNVDDYQHVINSDFSDGDQDFESDYQSWSGAFGFGQYAIITSPAIVVSTFPPCVDHTDGTGNMMLVWSTNVVDNIWCQTIEVEPESDYELSLWIASVPPASFGSVRWEVNGEYVGPSYATNGVSCDWLEVSETWTSPPDTYSAEVCITNQDAFFLGNAFALDDITVTGICASRDTMTVFLEEPEEIVIDTIICDGEVVEVNGAFYSTSGAYDAGVGPGSGVCDANYRLNLDVLEITIDNIQEFSAPCPGGFTDVDVAAFGTGDGTNFSWSTLDGNIVSGGASSRMRADQSGTYDLNISTFRNGVQCDTMISVALTVGSPAPIVDAGPDQEQCSPKNEFQLNGSITGDFVCFEWSPPDGLSNTEILDPIANVNGTATYTLTASSILNGENIVENGDFEQGNILFTTDYTFQGTGQLDEENYRLTTDGRCRDDWCATGDHTSGTGNYMCVNAATRGNVAVWEQTVNVQPNTDYLFSVWLVTLFSQSPPELQFEINGEDLGDIFTGPSAICRWEQSGQEKWNSGDATTALLRIVNRNTESFGNDFGLDDIEFIELCETSDMVTLTVLPPERMTLDTILCETDTIFINGVAYTEEGFFPDIMTTDDDGCDVIIDLTINKILIDIIPQDTIPIINCRNIDAILTADVVTSLGDITYSWNALTGSLAPPLNERTVTALSEGIYELTASVTFDGKTCTETELFEVQRDLTEPIADAGPDVNIDCGSDAIWLNGNIVNFTTASWRAINGGNIVSRNDSTSISINSSGEYIYTLIDTLTGCSNTDTLTVTNNDIVISVSISEPDTLNCETLNTSLVATVTGTDSFNIVWALGGTILQDSSTRLTMISDTGNYLITITDIPSGCDQSAMKRVVGDYSVPDLTMPIADTLRCNDSLSLRAITSTPETVINWSTSTGNILSTDTTGFILLDQPGIYFAMATGQNGCETIDSIEVFAEVDFPSINILEPLTLNCDRDTVTLDASGSSNVNTSPKWSTSTGNIINGPDDLIIRVDQPGTYYLEIVNTLSNCFNLDSIVVLEDVFTPQFSIPENDTLNCAVSSRTIPLEFLNRRDNILTTLVEGDARLIDITEDSILNITGPGRFIIQVQDPQSACFSLDTINVAIDTLVPRVDIQFRDTLTCTTTSTIIDITTNVPIADPLDIVWSTQDGIILDDSDPLRVSIQGSAMYLVSVVNTNNFCTFIDSIFVPEIKELPTIDFTPPNTLNCLVDTVQAAVLSSELTNFIWTRNNVTLAGNRSDASSITLTESGNYALVYSLDRTGCTDSIVFTVTADSLAPVISLNVTDTVLCPEDTELVTMNITSNAGDVAWNWTGGGGTDIQGTTDSEQFEVRAAGVYTLSVSNTQNGCVDSETISFAEEVFDFNVSVSRPSCLSDSGFLEVMSTSHAIEDLMFSINSVPVFNFPYPVTTGTYQISVSSPADCFLDTTITVNPNVEEILFIDELNPIKSGECTVINPFYSGALSEIDRIQWTGPEIQEVDTASLTALVCPFDDATYELDIWTLDGCQYSASIDLRVLVSDVYIPNIFTPNDDNLNDVFTIYGDASVEQINTFQIFNRWGDLVHNVSNQLLDNESVGWDGRVNGQVQDNGVYVYHVTVQFRDGRVVRYEGDITLIK